MQEQSEETIGQEDASIELETEKSDLEKTIEINY